MGLLETSIKIAFAGGICATQMPMPARLDLENARFDRLVAIRPGRKGHWLCRCDCGNEVECSTSNLRTGNSKSCGCRNRDAVITRNTTHGLSKHPLYITWKNMRGRCYSPNRPDYPYYGGRGIRVCERWHAFENFLADVGERPEGMTIERVDNARDYEPSNVIWASRTRQARNRRSTKLTIVVANAIRDLNPRVRVEDAAIAVAERFGIAAYTVLNVWYGAAWRDRSDHGLA